MNPKSKTKIKKAASLLIMIAVIPAMIAAGTIVFYDRRYMLVSTAVAAASCVLFFISFEGREHSVRRTVLLAAMTALSVAGRSLFAPIPFFKPVTAVVVICGMNLGCESGFLCGALSAFFSNFIFTQGPWTPFQMFIWGMIGFIAGVLSKPLEKSRLMLAVYGIAAGVVYSAFMDIWTTVWWDGSFLLSRYVAAISAALPVTMVYAISNVVFLMTLSKPIGEKLARIQKKYGLLQKET